MISDNINTHGRGKCLDILSDAEKAAKDGLTILKRHSFAGSEDQRILNLVIEFFEDYIRKIKVHRENCFKLNHEKIEDNLEVLGHIALVNQFIRAPTDLSRIVVLFETWKSQMADSNLGSDAKFAERFVADAFRDLGIDTIPVALFADRFTAFDGGPIFFVTIPIVLHKTYERWHSIAHEIGHAYFARTNGELDKNDLLKEIEALMRNDVPHIIDEKKTESGAAMLLFVNRWLDELLADYVGLALFGLRYLLEMRHSHDELVISLVSMSHPPVDFRINCLRWALKKNRIDLGALEEEFEYSSSIQKEMEPIYSCLTSNKMAERFSVWLLKQPPYQRIRNNWTEILVLGKQDVSPETRLTILFAVLSLEAISEDVEDIFQALKMKSIRDSE